MGGGGIKQCRQGPHDRRRQCSVPCYQCGVQDAEPAGAVRSARHALRSAPPLAPLPDDCNEAHGLGGSGRSSDRSRTKGAGYTHTTMRPKDRQTLAARAPRATAAPAARRAREPPAPRNTPFRICAPRAGGAPHGGAACTLRESAPTRRHGRRRQHDAPPAALRHGPSVAAALTPATGPLPWGRDSELRAVQEHVQQAREQAEAGAKFCRLRRATQAGRSGSSAACGGRHASNGQPMCASSGGGACARGARRGAISPVRVYVSLWP